MKETLAEKKSFFDSIFEKFMDKLYGIEFNSSIETSVKHSVELFNSAKKMIWVADGRFETGLWLSPEVVNSLSSAASRGVDVRVLSGPEIDKSNAEVQEAGAEGKIKFHHLRNEPYPKFIIVDENHIRVEEFNIDRDNFRKAFIVRNSRMLAKSLAMDFNELWNQSWETKFK